MKWRTSRWSRKKKQATKKKKIVIGSWKYKKKIKIKTRKTYPERKGSDKETMKNEGRNK